MRSPVAPEAAAAGSHLTAACLLWLLEEGQVSKPSHASVATYGTCPPSPTCQTAEALQTCRVLLTGTGRKESQLPSIVLKWLPDAVLL